MRRVWKNHGLSITVAVVFIVAWMLQTLMGWGEFVAQQRAAGVDAEVFGPDGYVWSWGRSTFENWQSEFLQVFAFIVLTTFLVHRMSHESPDRDFDTEATLRRIEARLARIETAQGAASRGILSAEEQVTAEQVEHEHLRSVSVLGHWAYLIGVVTIGLVLTVILLGAIQGAITF